MPEQTEAQRFVAAMKHLVKVPKAEILKREAEIKAERKAQREEKRKKAA